MPVLFWNLKGIGQVAEATQLADHPHPSPLPEGEGARDTAAASLKVRSGCAGSAPTSGLRFQLLAHALYVSRRSSTSTTTAGPAVPFSANEWKPQPTMSSKSTVYA